MGLAERLWNKENSHAPFSVFENDIKTVIDDLVKIDPNCQIIVFGSVAKNIAGIYSDIDLAVYLPENVDLSKFRSRFYRERKRIKRPLDIIFRKKYDFIVQEESSPIDEEINFSGIEVYPNWSFNG